jgi:hypothetical protein
MMSERSGLVKSSLVRTGVDQTTDLSLYIDSAAIDAAAELQKLGGAIVVLATAPC